MKLFSIITFIIVIFLSVTFVNDDDTLLVEYYVCYIYNDDIEDRFTTFIEQVQVYLQDKNIDASFETNSIFLCNSSIPLADARMTLWAGHGRDMSIDLSSQNLHDISPILRNEEHLSTNIDNDYAPELLATALMYQAGHIDVAEKNLLNLQDRISDATEVSEINYYLGNIALLNGDFQLALEYFENWMLSTSAHSVNYAWLLVQVGEGDKAIRHITEIVEIWEGFFDFDYSGWLSTRANIYALTFDYTSAIDDMDSAIAFIESDEFDRDLYMETSWDPIPVDWWLSMLYKQRGDIIMLIYEWNRALEDYNTAIELAPYYAKAYYRRGVLLYTMVERDDAIADFEMYLELNPDGQFADSASEYIDNIQGELDALGG